VTGSSVSWGLVFILILVPPAFVCEELHAADCRNIRTGFEIPSENYTDQPYVVVTKDNHWLCTLTTGAANKGQTGQHLVATTSGDKGGTSSELIDIEPADGPQASWVMPLLTPSGRVYAFYAYNGDNVETLPGGRRIRADVLGWYCYRYSDDNGRSWSKRHRLPVRVTACDRGNDWAGQVQLMWGIGKPIIHENLVFFGFTKLGRHMLDNGEGWFFRCDNVLTEADVSKIRWQMLPDGEHGLRAPEFGSIQEEHNLVALGTGDLYCMYRTRGGILVTHTAEMAAGVGQSLKRRLICPMASHSSIPALAGEPGGPATARCSSGSTITAAKTSKTEIPLGYAAALRRMVSFTGRSRKSYWMILICRHGSVIPVSSSRMDATGLRRHRSSTTCLKHKPYG
jgi:hypothetical protein